MSIEANKRTVERFFDEGFNGRRDDVFDQLIAPGYRHREAAGPQSVGADNLKETVRWLAGAFSDVRHELVELLAEDDRVWATTVMTGTQDGPFLGVPPSGRRFASRQVHMFRIDGDGRVCEHAAVRDDLSVLVAIGAVTPPAPVLATLNTPQPSAA